MGILSVVLLSVFGISAVLLVIIILLQDEQSEGLGGIFGGGSSNQVGNRQGNILTKATTVLGVLFLLIAFLVAWMSHTGSAASGIEKAAQAKKSASASVEWWKKDATDSNAAGATATTVAPVSGTTPTTVSSAPGAAATVTTVPAVPAAKP